VALGPADPSPVTKPESMGRQSPPTDSVRRSGGDPAARTKPACIAGARRETIRANESCPRPRGVNGTKTRPRANALHEPVDGSVVVGKGWMAPRVHSFLLVESAGAPSFRHRSKGTDLSIVHGRGARTGSGSRAGR